MSVKIQITFRKLAEIAEKSPGYSVVALGDDEKSTYEFTNIRFRQRLSGRRDLAVVLVTYNGREGVFDSDSSVYILD